jgi:site-specific DNA-methyltransferase (cytosine-N4-specific)
MNKAQANQFLPQATAALHRMQVKVDRLDGGLVEQDIAARKQEAQIGWEFAKLVDRIEGALKATGSNLKLDQWCKQEVGCDIRTMRRRKRLYKRWKEYEAKRRELGSCGQTGLLFALSLVANDIQEPATNGQSLSVRSPTRTSISRKTDAMNVSRCQFITGDALSELRKMESEKVNVIITSPPYWPAKDTYEHRGVGFEKTVEEFIKNLVSIFREAKRVLRDDGILWVSIDDSYLNRSLSFIPARFALAMVDDGWTCRAEIVWNKTNLRPDAVSDRPTKDHEKLLMFVKEHKYFYDPDPIRIPPTGRYNQSGFKKRAAMRSKNDFLDRYYTNPLGRNGGSMWQVEPTVYRNGHAATFPLELVQRMLMVSCRENSLVLDIFGGAGTTALAALKLGHRAISIEINPAYTKEAQERTATEEGMGEDVMAAE